jgi:hypothetical protein
MVGARISAGKEAALAREIVEQVADKWSWRFRPVAEQDPVHRVVNQQASK